MPPTEGSAAPPALPESAAALREAAAQLATHAYLEVDARDENVLIAAKEVQGRVAALLRAVGDAIRELPLPAPVPAPIPAMNQAEARAADAARAAEAQHPLDAAAAWRLFRASCGLFPPAPVTVPRLAPPTLPGPAVLGQLRIFRNG